MEVDCFIYDMVETPVVVKTGSVPYLEGAVSMGLTEMIRYNEFLD